MWGMCMIFPAISYVKGEVISANMVKQLRRLFRHVARSTCGGLRLRVTSADLTVGEIELVGDYQAGTVSARGDNLLPGTVHWASYLGDAVDPDPKFP